MGIMRPRPRVLHLFSEWKWTGPAEPVVNLCRELRRLGFVVDLACARAPGQYPQSLEHHARERRVEPVLDFTLNKKPNIIANRRDIRAVAEFIDREEVQIVHVHSSHDHYIGSRAARRANNQPRVVRSNHRGEPLPANIWNRLLIRGYTDGWVALTQECLEADLRNFGIPPSYGVVVEGAVDLERFNAAATYADVRPELGLHPDDVLVGIVARVQSHRRFDVLLEAFAIAMREMTNLYGMIIGRGTRFDALVRQPLLRLGLTQRVFLPGYRTHDYPDYLAALDIKVFLVPGSDGSCRAVREAMAMGKPVIVARRGILPKLVEDGRCGLVIEDTPENLARAILRLARDPALRRRLGAAAAKKAQEEFRLDRQVEIMADLYARLAERA